MFGWQCLGAVDRPAHGRFQGASGALSRIADIPASCFTTARIGEIIQEEKASCFAWALIPNHAHLLLRTGTTPLARMMRRLLTGYAVSFNLRHQRSGHLFQNRYKSIVCEKDSYLLELVRYIHLNAIRAGLVKDLRELNRYRWSGHSVLMGYEQRDWQAKKEVLSHFGRRKRYAPSEQFSPVPFLQKLCSGINMMFVSYPRRWFGFHSSCSCCLWRWR